MVLKIPESDGGKYTYKNIELVHHKCEQYWKRRGKTADASNRKECEKEIRQLRLAGII